MGAMPEVVAKGPILSRIDKLSLDRAKLESALADLTGDDLDLVAIGLKYKVLGGWKEVSHIRDEWFRTWWPQAQPIEPILRQGLITAVQKALGRSEDQSAEKHLPLDVYWICHPGHGQPGHSGGSHEHGGGSFEVSVAVSGQQVTVNLHSPGSPYEDDKKKLNINEPIQVVKRNGVTGEIFVEQVMTKMET